MNHRVEEYNLSVGILRQDHFFEIKEGSLAGFIRIHIPISGPVIHVIDITSARAFRHFSSNMQEFYLKHGYQSDLEIPRGFGMIALDGSLGYIKSKYPDKSLVVLKTLERNRAILEQSIFQYFPESSHHIKKVTGGGEDSVATLYL